MGNQNKPVRWSAAPRHGVALAALCAAVAAVIAGPAAAQRVVGARTEPNVIVDLSVLDELGPRRNLPQLLLPTTRPPARAGAPYPRSFPPAAAGDAVTVLPAPSVGGEEDRIILKKPSRATKVRKPRRKTTRTVKRTPKPKPAPKPPPAAITRVEPPAPVPVPPPKPAPTPSMAAAPPPPAASVPPPPSVAGLPAPEIKPLPPEGPEPAAGPGTGAQVAAVPPAAPTARTGGPTRVLFDAGSAKLTRAASRQLKSVAEAMAADGSLRLELLAFADGSAQSASRSRRLSLSRALAARSYLIAQGVRSTRIDVRALGNKTAGGPPDRIDVVVTSR